MKAAFVAGLLTHRQPTIYLAFGMQAGAAAVIAETAYSLGAGVVRARVLLSDLVMASSFAAVFFFRISAVYVLAAAAVIGGLRAAALRLKAART